MSLNKEKGSIIIYSKLKFSFYHLFVCVLFLFQVNIAYPQSSSPEGFALVNALGQNGTTGGAGETVVTVTNAAQFLDYIGRSGAYIIEVNGTISLSGMESVQSNKTIIGVGTNGIISGGGLHLSEVSNIIIRNLIFQGSSDDTINVQTESHHIWIDHCDLTNANDGLIDIKRGSDYITVS